MTLDICYEISFEISVRMLEKISDGTTENFSTRNAFPIDREDKGRCHCNGSHGLQRRNEVNAHVLHFISKFENRTL